MSIKYIFLYPLVWIISEYLIGKDMEGSRCYPVWGVLCLWFGASL